MTEARHFWPITQTKCNEEKNKILNWITDFPFFPPKSHFSDEYGDFRYNILLRIVIKHLSVDNEKLDPFSCQPVLFIAFYLGQDILQLKKLKSLYLVF